MIQSKTPVRIACGGGGTDVEPYSSDFNGYVVNVTINNYFRSILNKRDDKLIRIFSNDKFSAYKFEEIEKLKMQKHSPNLIKAIIYSLKPKIGMDIYLHGEPPKKAGLGASASLSTSLIAGILKLENYHIDLNDIAEKAFNIEQNILKNVGGRQDQYASVHGGFNGIKFLGNSKVKVENLKISKTFKRKIEENLILFYTGESHTSGDIVKEQIKSYLNDKLKAIKSLNKLKEIAYQIRDSLVSEDFEKFGKLLTEDWNVKTKFNPLITTNYMRELNNIVMNNGGIGGRVCGAGGGGCLIWLITPGSRERIFSLLKKKNGKIIDFKFVDRGLEISNI